MKTIFSSFALLSFLLLVGCYHLGNPSELSFHRIYIAPVENKTYIPQAQAIITSQLRQQLLRDGRILVSDLEDAQVILSVCLTNYKNTIVATQEEETGLAKSFNFNLTAECSLYDATNQSFLFEKKNISAHVNTLVDGGVQIAEYQSVLPLGEKLAQKIKDLILNPW